MMALDRWGQEVATLASVVDRTGPMFTEGEKRHWTDRLARALEADEAEASR